MYFTKRPFKAIVLAATVSTISLSSANAFEASDVAERLHQVFTRQHANLTYDEASMQGDDILLSNVAVVRPNGETALKLGDLVLEDVTEDADGNYRIERIVKDEIRVESEGTVLTITGDVEKGIVLIRDAETDPLGGIYRSESGNIAHLKMVSDLGLVLEITDLRNTTEISDDFTLDDRYHFGRFTLDTRQMDSKAVSSGFRDFLKDMNLEQISGSAEFAYTLAPSTGVLTLSKTQVLIDDIGSIDMTGSFGGYSPALLKQFAEFSTLEAHSEEDQAKKVAAALQFFQHLMFNDVSIRYEDGGFAERLLKALAVKHGSTRDGVLQHAKAMIAEIAPKLEIPFGKSVKPKLEAFLNDPQTIEVSAKPEKPMSFTMMLMTGAASPKALFEQLNLKLTTNE